MACSIVPKPLRLSPKAWMGRLPAARPPKSAVVCVRALPNPQRPGEVDLEILATDLKHLSEKLTKAAVQLPGNREQDTWQQQKDLWERQERLWQREMQRWDDERKMWATREAALVQEVQRLHEALRLCLPQAPQLPVSAGARSPSPSPQDARLHGSLLSAEAANTAGSVSVLQNQEMPAAAATGTTGELPPLAATFAAAFAAVNETDVLGDVNFDQIAQRIQGRVNSASPPGRPTSVAAVTAPDGKDHGASADTGPGAAVEGLVDGYEGANPEGPPPPLSQGADDIVWVSRLHNALVAAGFHVRDEDVEDFLFGPSTEEALLFFQAACRIPETGVVDDLTWECLLKQQDQESDPAQSTTTAQILAALKEAAAAAAASGDEAVHSSSQVVVSSATPSAAASPNPTPPPVAADAWAPEKFPVLRELDGGREVHALQVALRRAGCYPGEDDLAWWQFGDSTRDAVLMFQACNGLPETGVCDVGTWQKLLPGGSPSDLPGLQDGENDHDLSAETEGRVWLLGEQRWSTS